MGFKTVQALEADTTISLGNDPKKKSAQKNPTQVEGYYLGKRSIDDKKKKSGVSYIHFFQTEAGNLGVWGKTDLDRKMESVVPGSMTRATFSGMRPTPNGDMYTFKVEVDSENTIEVAGLTSSATSISEVEDTYGGESVDEYQDVDDEAATAAELAAAAQDAAARKAKVQALLNRNKKA